ncbi:MAG TPA: DUF4115 domain-containing protein [Anaerolineae bacterium]|nr:DUF4115 domain-containing protein [Anaerolineae bacterium]HPL29370.1 DUF4115 domain-containing protein [Anaerolineae bacterium]
MGELGERLRQAREAKGLTLEQVEEITKIRRRYLQALEEEDFGQLPGEVFVRGFLRNYALALGLDAEEILTASGRKVPPPVPPVEERPAEILDEPLVPPAIGQRIVAIAIGAMVVIALVVGGWALYRFLGPPAGGPAATATLPAASPTSAQAVLTAAPPAATATPSTTPTAEPTATDVPLSGVLLRLGATARCWLRVTIDGRLAYEGNLEAGQVQEWQGAEQIFLRTGNAGGLRIWYNGQEVEPIGGPGEVVERAWQAGALPEGVSPGEPAGERTPAPVGPPPSSPTPTPDVPTDTPTPDAPTETPAPAE